MRAVLLFAGLGNPGAKYVHNRHNVGFMAVDAIAERQGFSGWSSKFGSEIAEGEIDGVRTFLIKPQTFMNVSGEAIGAVMRFYKLQPGSLVVFHDELDLAPGKVRVKTGGGHGGHNGIKSIDAHCGKDYRRVRIGIGHPGVKHLVHHHVLGDFVESDSEWLTSVLDAVAQNAGLLAKGDDAGFMNRVALATGQSDDKRGARADKAGTKQDRAGVDMRKPSRSKSHIHQAHTRAMALTGKMPEAGPMAKRCC